MLFFLALALVGARRELATLIEGDLDHDYLIDLLMDWELAGWPELYGLIDELAAPHCAVARQPIEHAFIEPFPGGWMDGDTGQILALDDEPDYLPY